jgi:hypothetical protein
MLAEEDIKKEIATCSHDVGEEFITQRFHGIYYNILAKASQAKKIEKVFLMDLRRRFPYLTRELNQISDNLIAEVTLHEKTTEKVTGGDIGILIIRPHVYEHGNHLNILDYKRGLLCQAKMKNKKGKWGGFTDKQTLALPGRLQYLTLLLYQYEDKFRHNLASFSWQLCNSFAFSEVKKWLIQDNFPELVSSAQVISQLGSGRIGTDDDDILNSVILPSANRTLVIKITWPENSKPGGARSCVRILSREENYGSEQTIIRN